MDDKLDPIPHHVTLGSGEGALHLQVRLPMDQTEWTQSTGVAEAIYRAARHAGMNLGVTMNSLAMAAYHATPENVAVYGPPLGEVI